MSTNSIKTLRLKETHRDEQQRNTDETATMLRLWQLLGRDSGLRDQTIGQRKFL